MKTYVQQIMLGTVTSNEAQARETLEKIKAAGYDGLELNSFMIHPTGMLVRMLTKAAGMPTGKGGKLDWHAHRQLRAGTRHGRSLPLGRKQPLFLQAGRLPSWRGSWLDDEG